MTTPLEGLKILELAKMAQGPGAYCAMMLSDLGAEVTRIAPAGGRAAEPLYVMSSEDAEGLRVYDPEGRNRRCIMLDLKSDEALEIFYKLVEGADVVMEGMRAGVVKRLKVDYDTLKEKNPRIIYLSLTGYGQTGAYKDLVGHDVNYISLGGALGMIKEKGRKPIPPSNIVADYAGGGLQAVIGVLAAVIARERTGRGQHLDVAMVDGVISLMHFAVGNHFQAGGPGTSQSDMFTGKMPHYNVYETRDGKFISIGSLEPAFFHNLCKAIGREDLIPLEWRIDKWDELTAGFEETFLTRTRDEWFAILKETDTCVAPVYDVDEIFDDPHVQERDMLVELDHPRLGKIKQVGVPIKFSDTPGEVRSLAPTPGEHTDEVLLELGYSQQQIDELRNSGVIA